MAMQTVSQSRAHTLVTQGTDVCSHCRGLMQLWAILMWTPTAKRSCWGCCTSCRSWADCMEVDQGAFVCCTVLSESFQLTDMVVTEYGGKGMSENHRISRLEEISEMVQSFPTQSRFAGGQTSNTLILDFEEAAILQDKRDYRDGICIQITPEDCFLHHKTSLIAVIYCNYLLKVNSTLSYVCRDIASLCFSILILPTAHIFVDVLIRVSSNF